MNKKLFIVAFALLNTACSSQSVPQAHKGRMFDKTGAAALFVGGRGFEGPILTPGTYFTGLYPEIRMVECTQQTIKESMTALTKDGVQFGMDLYIRFGVNCDDDKIVMTILEKLSPEIPQTKEGEKPAETHADPTLTISSNQVYKTYIRPAIGEAVREVVSPYIANEVNSKREEIFARIRDRFNDLVKKQEPKFVNVYDLNLSNLVFPDEMNKANTDRATQAILKDKAVAERERVTAEIETAKMRKQLSEAEAQQDVARIDAVGAAYHRNPEYVTVEALHYAGDRGNLIIVPLNSQNIIQLPARK